MTVTVGGAAVTGTVETGAADGGAGVVVWMTGVSVGPCAVVAPVEGAQATSVSAASGSSHS